MRIEVMKGMFVSMVVAVSMASIIPVSMIITGEVVVVSITFIVDSTTTMVVVPLMSECNAPITTTWQHLLDHIRYHPKDTSAVSVISQDIGFKLVQPKTMMIIIISVK